MKSICKIVIIVFAVAVTTSYGTPVIGYTEAFGTDAGWVADTSLSAASVLAVGGTLQLTIPGDSPTPASGVYAGTGASAGNFSGDFYGLASTLGGAHSNLVVSFNLQTINNYNDQPGSMWMYFVGNGHRYSYATSLNQPVTNSVTPYSFIIGNSYNWLNSDGGTFATDFGSVTNFGFGFTSTGDSTDHIIQLGGIQFNQEFQVPEPETIWMMVVVLASLGITFRGRLTDLGSQVKASLIT